MYLYLTFTCTIQVDITFTFTSIYPTVRICALFRAPQPVDRGAPASRQPSGGVAQPASPGDRVRDDPQPRTDRCVQQT